MDILLDKDGDLLVTERGDIMLENSVAQKIRIRLLWFAEEWRWNKEEGLPYMTDLLIKNPDTDYFESLIREKIFEVEEVVDVKDVQVIFNKKTREAEIHYVALTDYETINEEVEIKCQIME